jgi:hypothetical protein
MNKAVKIRNASGRALIVILRYGLLTTQQWVAEWHVTSFNATSKKIARKEGAVL